MRMRDKTIVEKTMFEDQRREYSRKDNAQGREKKIMLNFVKQEIAFASMVLIVYGSEEDRQGQ